MSNDKQILLLGQALQNARMQCKYSIQEVAETLNLSKFIIEDIESSLDEIIEGRKYSFIYLRGYLVNFSKLVNLHDLSSFAEFKILIEQQQEKKRLPKPSLFKPVIQKKHHIGAIFSALSIVLVVYLVIAYWQQLVGLTELNMTENNILPVMVKEGSPHNVALSIAPENTLSDGIEKNEISTKVLNKSKPKVDKPVRVSLILTYSADCWTEIKDANNKRIVFGLYKKGRTLTLQGLPPFHLKLGDPSVVEIQYQHEIIKHKFESGKSALFVLPMT
ncbi:hypothetical protein JI57_01225 [Psychromonas sp. PRT-SC03]|nr:hypothetical protein JI57_01225 [Psychromonas sp. PRT-SC03]